MDERLKRMEELFAEAVERPSAERDAFLRTHCGDDAEMLEELRRLIQGHELAGDDFLRLPPPDTRWAEVLRPPAVDPLIGAKLAGFTIQRLLARGGMGTVYLAEQERPHRQVALKVLHTGLWSRSAARRFEFEAQVLAHLSHPHIAQVYEAGTARPVEGTPRPFVREVPYFVMEYVPEARTLTQYASEHRLSAAKRLELFLQACDAVHHGHQKGIIHRDLKPANLLVDAEGRVKVIDFGVARAVDDDLARTTMHTEAGHLVGTLAYMSPEQCEGDPHAIDVRSDLYSLGVVLYELLCERLPYDVSKTSLYAATRVIRETPPARPSMVTGGDSRCPPVRGDLETILLKALEKDRADRYQSVEALARDIRHYLAGELIEARAPTVLRVVGRLFRRYRWQMTTAAAVVLLAVVGSVALVVGDAKDKAQQQRQIAEQQREEALAQRQIAEAAKQKAGMAAYGAALAAADTSILVGDSGQTAQILKLAKEKLGGPDLPDRSMPWEWRHLWHRRTAAVRELRVGSVQVTGLALSPDRRWLAAGGGPIDAVHLKLIDLAASADADPQRTSIVSGYGNSFAFSPDGGLLAAVVTKPLGDAVSSVISVWTFADGRLSEAPIRCWFAALSTPLTFHPRERILAASPLSDESAIALWDLRDLVEADAAPSAAREPPPLLAMLTGHSRHLASLVFSPGDGRLLASGSHDTTIRLWDMGSLLGDRSAGDGDDAEPRIPAAPDHDANTLAVILGHADHVTALAFSPDGRRLASGSVDRSIRLWDVRKALTASGNPTGGGDAEKTIDTSSEALIGTLQDHTAGVMALAWNDDGTRLYSAGGDAALRVWNVEASLRGSDASRRLIGTTHPTEPLATLPGHTSPVHDLAVLNDGRVVSAGEDGFIRFWQPETESVPTLGGHLGGHFGIVPAVAFSPDGRLVLTGSIASLFVWDAETSAPLAVEHHANRLLLNAMAVIPGPAPSTFYVAAAMQAVSDRTGQDVAQARELWHHDDGLVVWYRVTTLPNGRVELETLADLDAGRQPVLSLAVGGHGRRLAAGGFNGHEGTIQVWDLADPLHPRRIAERSVEGPGITALAFLDEEGSWLASGNGSILTSSDATHRIRLWRLEGDGTLSPGQADYQHPGNVLALMLSPNGDWLASGSADAKIRLWRVVRSGLKVELVEQPEPDGVLIGHTDGVMCLAFDAEGNRLFSGSLDRTLKVWDLATRVEVATLHGHLGRVCSLAFDPTHERLVSGSGGFRGSDNIARLWESEASPETRRQRAAVRRAQQMMDRAFAGPVESIDAVRRQLCAATSDRGEADPAEPSPEAATTAVSRGNGTPPLPEDCLTAAARTILRDHFDAMLPSPHWMIRWAAGTSSNPRLSPEDYSRALHLADDVVRRAPNWVWGRFEQGVLLCRLKRFDEAVAAFEEGLRWCRDPAGLADELRACIAWARRLQGRPDLAAQSLGRVRTWPATRGSLFVEHAGLAEEIRKEIGLPLGQPGPDLRADGHDTAAGQQNPPEGQSR